jgi:hypothetical protein
MAQSVVLVYFARVAELADALDLGNDFLLRRFSLKRKNLRQLPSESRCLLLPTIASRAHF